jgi:hypothetical protein
MTANKQVVSLLLMLQLVATIFLWTLSSIGTADEGRFAVFLAVDLLSFAMVAFVFAHDKWGEEISRGWILMGSIGLVVLLLSSLFFQ